MAGFEVIGDKIIRFGYVHVGVYVGVRDLGGRCVVHNIHAVRTGVGIG